MRYPETIVPSSSKAAGFYWRDAAPTPLLGEPPTGAGGVRARPGRDSRDDLPTELYDGALRSVFRPIMSER